MHPDPTDTLDRLTVGYETELDGPEADRLYGDYLTAFAPLRSRSAARHVLHRDEFLAMMSDARVIKVLGRRSGEPVAVALLTNVLETVPWISPEYFRRLYPEHAARGAIYYLPFAFVGVDQRGEHLLDRLLTDVAARLDALGAVCAYDLGSYNNRTFAFADRIEAALRTVTAVEAVAVDTQTFYTVRAAS